MLLNRIRRSIAADDGVTVVETMFAIMVLTVAILGLMGTLIASAKSQLDQRSRTNGVRMASEQLETARQFGYDTLKADLLAGCPVGSSCAPRTETVNGQVYQITPVVTEVDARDPSLGPQPGLPTVMQVRTDVTWTVRGVTKSLSSTTAVSPVKPDAAKDIKSITLFPNPTVVSFRGPFDTTTVEGIPTQDVVVSVELKGLNAAAPVSVSYQNDGESTPRTYTLSTTDEKTWRVTIPRLAIKKAIPQASDFGELPFNLSVGIGGGLTLKQQQILLLSRGNNPPAIMPPRSGSFPSSKTYITCGQPANCQMMEVHKGSSSRGMNRQQVVFSAEVTALYGATGDKVEIWWQDPTQNNAWQGPLGLSKVSSDDNGSVWQRVLPEKGGVLFPLDQSGVVIRFWFLARRASDGQTNQQYIDLLVKAT